MTLLPCLTPAQLRCYIAVCQLWDRDGRVTVRGLASALGFNINATRGPLDKLRAEGLLTWERGRCGTLRPLYRVTVFTSPSRGGVAGEGCTR